MANDPESFRCTHCDVNWPPTDSYSKTCPTCGRATWRARYERPISPNEAGERIRKHKKRATLNAEFDDFYSDREEKQAQEAVEDLLRDLGLAV